MVPPSVWNQPRANDFGPPLTPRVGVPCWFMTHGECVWWANSFLKTKEEDRSGRILWFWANSLAKPPPSNLGQFHIMSFLLGAFWGTLPLTKSPTGGLVAIIFPNTVHLFDEGKIAKTRIAWTHGLEYVMGTCSSNGGWCAYVSHVRFPFWDSDSKGNVCTKWLARNWSVGWFRMAHGFSCWYIELWDCLIAATCSVRDSSLDHH